ncbi:MAG: single-stranded DNA-binding protein [Bacteroidia bacterium]|nr:single-stranded DNA-binding protein [Bacteroidia bacterium]MDW8158873.1 single-stranded DNA-binding protein [Bacteroidia bacterium]
MLRLQVIGYIGRDAEVRDGGGNKVISFSVAHTEKYKDRNGVLQEKTTWVRCSYWRPPDKIGVAEYLKKGTQVYVEGTPSVNSYINEENRVVASLECRVSSIQLLGSRASFEQRVEDLTLEENFAQEKIEGVDNINVDNNIEPENDLPF